MVMKIFTSLLLKFCLSKPMEISWNYHGYRLDNSKVIDNVNSLPIKKSTFLKNSFRNTTRVSNSLDPDQAQNFVC